LPPVSAQNRKELAVQLQLLTVDADDDCLSPQRVVTLSASAAVPVIPFPGEVRRPAPQAPGYLICAIGNSNPDFWIPD
jgi:hypothetical protein